MRLKVRFFTRRKLIPKPMRIYLRLGCLQLYHHSHAVTQGTPHSLRNPQFHRRSQKTPSMVRNQNWLYPAHTLLPYYLEIFLNIVLSFTLRSSKSSLALSASEHVTSHIAAQIFRRFGGAFCLYH
jgi:hypothetical protein